MKSLAWAACIALLACGAPSSPRPSLWGAARPEWGPPQPGDRAPDFELPRTLEDGTTSLASLRGSWVLLHFTATWCPFCDTEIGSLVKIADAYAPRNVRVVLVGVEEPVARWIAYAKERVHPPIVALHDLDGKVASQFSPPKFQPSFKDRAETVLAASIIIDPQGIIRMFVIADSVHFDSSLADIRGELDRLLAGDKTASAGPSTIIDDVVVKTDAPLVKAKRGGHGELIVVVDIASGWHVMSNHPTKPEYIPTVLEASASGISFGEAIYPPPTSFDLGASTLATFEGHLALRVPFDVKDDAAPGKHSVVTKLTYQACTHASCRFPRSDVFAATIEVEL
jgi:peroxiredoxin